MKKRLSLFLLMCITALAAFAEPVTVFSEDFESESTFARWTQEVKSSDTCFWMIDTVSTNPNGAYLGTGRAVLRNSTGTTKGFVTRLITPALNLPYDEGASYQVFFAYAQALKKISSTISNFDSLKVYYSSDGTTWKLLRSFADSYQNKWQTVMIDLPGSSGGKPNYKLAFEAYDAFGQGVVLDEVIILKKSTCVDVSNFIAIPGVGSGILSYSMNGATQVQVVVDTLPRDMSEFDITTALYYAQTTEDMIEVTDLDSLRTYYAYVRSLCDDNLTGFTEWQSASFTTAVSFPFSENFSGGALPSSWQNLYGLVEDAFAGILPNKNTNTTYNWSYSTNTTVTGSTHAVGGPHYMYSGGAVYTPTWLVTPTIDLKNVEESNIELTFKLAMSSSKTSASEVTSKSDYKFMVLISQDGGATWEESNATTFEGIDLSSSATPRVHIDMTGFIGGAVKIAFVAIGNGTGAYFHIDDIKLGATDFICGGVRSLSVDKVTDVSAELNWTLVGKDSVVVELSKSASFASKIFSETVAPTDHKFALEALDNGTTYYVRVQQKCEDADWVSASFTTICGVPYAPTFSSTIPSDWNRFQATSQQLFADSATTTTLGWGLNNSYVWSAYHWKCEIYSTTYNYWVTSPIIYLNPATTDYARLSFDMALTKWNTANEASASEDDRIWVVISEDGGQTWNRQNATLWSSNPDDSADYAYNDIPNTGAKYKIDLTQYIGKSIKIAFGTETSVGGTDNDVHIHNISVEEFDPNCAGVEKIVLSADITDAKATWKYKGVQAAIAQLATNDTFTEGLITDTIAGKDSVAYHDLQANTKYYFRVMQNCEFGEWSDTKSFMTHCQADTIPYQYGFEDVAAKATPSCWTLICDGNGYPQVSASSYNSKSGSRSLIWGTTSQTNTAGITFASLPAFTSAVNQTEMSFWIRRASASKVDTLEIGVMTNPLDPETFVKVTQVIAKSTTYEQCVVSFANYMGDGRYIAFKRLNGNKYAMYIDDVDVHVLPPCHRMGDVSVGTITSTGATIQFQQTNAENFQIVLATEQIDPDSAGLDSLKVFDQVLPYASQMEISSAAIQPNTLYYLYVRGICSDEEKSAWSVPVSFTTLCAAVDPATYGVETFSTAKTMDCWKTGFLTAGTSSSYATAGRTTDTKFGAYLKLSKESVDGSYSYNDGAYAISPELAVDSINKYQITFSAATTKSEAANVSRLEIGVVTNPSDMDTYEKIKVIPLTYAADSTKEKVSVIDFKSYPGDIYGEFGRYIMFKSVAGADSTNYVLIDNISFQVAATCPQIIETSVDSIGLSSAVFHFENIGASQYEVLVSTINTGSVDTLSTAVMREFVATNRAELSGLNASTPYYAYVRAICSEGDTANWSASTAFTTAIGVPYFDELSDISTWSKFSGKVSAAFAGTAPTATTSGWAASSGKSCPGITTSQHPYYNLYGTSANYWLVSPEIDMTDQIGKNLALWVDLGFTAYTSGKTPDVSNQSLWILISTDNGKTWLRENAFEISATGTADADIALAVDKANRYQFYISKYAGQRIKVALCGQQSVTGGDNYIHIANIAIDTVAKIPFLGVSGAEFSNITLHTADMKFLTKATDVALYQYKLCTAGGDPSTVAAISSADQQLTLTGLTATTTYDVYVRGFSTEGDSCDWTGPVSFATLLGAPYTQDFAGGSIPADWSIMSGSPASVFTGTAPTASSAGWTVSTSSTGLPANHAKINIYSATTNRWLVMPNISLEEVLPGTPVMFSFDFAYTNYNSATAPDANSAQALYVVVSTDNGATWQQTNSWEWSHKDSVAAVIYPLDSITTTGNHIELDFSRFIGQSVKVGFVAVSTSGDNDFHVGSISLKLILSDCDNPTDLAISDITLSSAVLTFQGDENKQTIITLSKNADLSKPIVDTIQGVSYTINALDHSSKYYVAVQQICVGGNTEQITSDFTTLCGSITSFPWLNDFESYSTGDFAAPCYRNLHVAGTSTSVFKIAANTSGNTTQVLQVPYMATGNKALFATPAITVPESNEYELGISVYRNATGTTYLSEGVRVYVSQSDTIDSTAVELGFLHRNFTQTDGDIVIAESAAGWYTYYFTIPLAGDCHILLQSEAQGGAAINMDNLLVRKMPNCRAIKHIAIPEIEARQAKITFDYSGATFYEVLVSTSKVDLNQATLADTIFHTDVLTDSFVVATGLNPATQHYAYVRGLCGDEQSEWSSAIAFLTECEVLTITKENAYTMNFDNETAGTGTVPMCWETICDAGGYPYVYAYYARSGSNCLSFGGSSGKNKESYAILPEVANDVKDLQLNFFLRGYSATAAYNDSIIIGVMSNPEDVSTFVPVKGFQAASSSYVEQEVWLNTYAGSGHFIAIKRVPVAYEGYYSSSYYGSYIDDITLSKLPSCLKIQDLKASALSHSAKISHKASNAGQYELIVAGIAINPDSIATVADSLIVYHQTVADTAVTVSALLAQTKYYVYLRGVCGEEDKSDWATTNFTTLCDALTIGATTPYVMDFESEESGTIPSCWTKLGNSSYPYISTGTGATGSKYLYYGGYSGDYETTYTILPEFTNDINKLQLNFFLKGYSATQSYNDSIVIGIMSDPADTTTFVPMASYRPQTTTWTACEVLFDQYAGEGHFIVVKRVGIYYYGSLLDDFTVSLMPTCPIISSIKASNVSRREFDVTWTPKVATEGQHYDFVMSSTQLNETQLEAAAKLDLDTAFFHASGLDRETTRYIYVRTNCGAEEGVGAWANLTVKTKGLNACDEIIIADGTATNTFVPVYGTYVDDPQRSQSIYPASMLTELAGQQITALKYFVTSGGSTSSYNSWGDKEFTVRMAEVEETNLSSSFSSASMMSVYAGVLTASVENGMLIEFAEPFEYNGGNLLVEFELPVDQSGYAPCTFAGIDAADASRNAYGASYLTSEGTLRSFLPKMAVTYCYATEACPTVDSIGHELTGEGITTAHIAWSAGAGDYTNTYDLLISDTAVVDFASVVPTADSLAALSYDANTLTAYTDYYVYVRVNCDNEGKKDGRSGWSEAHHFKTNSACRVITDLDVVATGKTTALATWKATAQDNNFQYILSEVALSKEELEIATPTASALTDTFAMLSGLTSGQKYFLYVANSCGEEGTSPYIADSLQMPAGCPAVADLQTTYEAFNAVSLKWGRGQFGEENQWLVGIQGTSRDMVINDSAYTFIGLEADSTYTFFVQAICGEGDFSAIETLTVHVPSRPNGGAVIGEGTATNDYAPVYGLYCDNNQRSQSIYPADMLTELKGQTILELAYVVTKGSSVGTSGNWENATFNVRIGVTNQANLSIGWATDDVTTVYTGTLHASIEDGMHIVLDQPFTYEGGNLLIEFELPVKTGYASCTFQGVAQTGGSRTMYGTSTLGTARDFLPQVQFICAVAGCEPVKLAASNITTSSADVTWFPGDKEMSWATLLSDSALTAQALGTLQADTVTEMKRHFDGLIADHDYHFYIRSLCQPQAGAWKEFIFQTAPTCLIPVALHADSIDTYAAHVAWTDPNASLAGSYTVAYGLKKDFNLLADSTYATLSTTDTTALLTSLLANTEYSFAVRTDCGQGDLSRWSAVAEFRTECGAETITKTYNYVMDFENALDSMPDCWSAIRNGGTNPFVKDYYSYYAYSGTKYLSFGGYSGENKTQYAILPAMANDMDSLRIKFWMAGYASSSSYKNDSILVGVMSDPSDESTFVPVDCFQAEGDDWALYEVSFATYQGDGHYIAFKHVPVLAYASSYSSSYYGSYIDDVVVSLIPTCVKPASVVALAGIDTALITWTGEAISYIVEMASETATKIDTIMASDTALVLRGLLPGTFYNLRVTGVCDDGISDPSEIISFTTKQGLPFSENFDASMSIPSGWSRLSGDIFSGATSTTSGWTCSSGTGGDMGANHMYSGVYTSSSTAYMYSFATPEISLIQNDSNSLIMLGFDLALTNSTAGTTAPTSTATLNREFTVAISTDGGQTWTRTNASWMNGGSMGTYGDIPSSSAHFELDLTQYAGQNIMLAFFHSAGSSTSYTTTYIQLDNVQLFEMNPNCLGIKDLEVSNVSFTGANVSFGYKGGANDAVIVLSKSAVLKLDEALLVDTILNDSVYTIATALDASTTYYVFVEQLCGEDETSAWEMASFMTAYGVRYAPVLTSTIMPSDWGVYSGMFDGDSTKLTSASGWSVVSTNYGMPGYHFKANIYGTSSNKWLVTPAIDLTPNIGDGLLLTFDAALTKYNSADASVYNNADDRMLVLVTTDEGKTWKVLAEWNNAGTGDYVYDSLTNSPTSFHLDMSTYAGQTVHIAFYGESTVSGADNDLHVGNIVLDKVATVNYLGNVCDGQDYDGLSEGVPFYVESTDYKPGLNTYSTYVPADTSVAGSQDTILVLNLMVNEPYAYEYSATVCEGDYYDDGIFNLGTITSKTNPLQIQSGLYTVAGCDSSLVLHLTINPIQKIEINGLICQGSSYYFGGKYISVPGHYYDTTSSVVTGCDSISILHLSYDSPAEVSMDKILCYGDTFITAQGIIVTTPGLYTEVIDRSPRCDSTIHWTVMVADEAGVAYDTINQNDLPYRFSGKVVLNTSATVGSHDVTVPMSCGDGTLRIEVVSSEPTSLRDILYDRNRVQKLIIDEQLIIIKDGKMYNAQGNQL